MEALATLMPPTKTRKGDAMAEFFETDKYRRRPGTRISDFITIFEQGITRMVDEGAKIRDDDDTTGSSTCGS